MFYNDFETIRVHRNGRIFQLPKNPLSKFRFTTTSNGTGLGWSESSPDIDQPIGLAYRELQDLRKGVRIRADKQHTTYGGSSCGGLHKPGKASILLVETTVNFADYIVAASLCGAARYGIAYDTSGYLWHVSDNTLSFCALGINPNSLCVGANWEYSGPVKFDGSIDFSGALYVDATVDIDGYLMCGSDIGIAEHLACNSGAQFLGPVTCSTGFHCGTASCYADASFAAARFHCASNIYADFTTIDITTKSNLQRCKAFAYARFTGNAATLLDSYNIASIGWTTPGAFCLQFSTAADTSLYVVAGAVHDASNNNQGKGFAVYCISCVKEGVYLKTKDTYDQDAADVCQVSLMVFGG